MLLMTLGFCAVSFVAGGTIATAALVLLRYQEAARYER